MMKRGAEGGGKTNREVWRVQEVMCKLCILP